MRDYDQPGEVNVDCAHKRAQHRHGTKVAYALDRCRCPECAGAARRYVRWYAKNGGDRTSAVLARLQVLAFMDQGMGLKRIAEVSDLPHGGLSRLIYGSKDRPPSRTITRSTEERILALELDVNGVTQVPREEADLIVHELVARGWRRWQIARALGADSSASGLQIFNESTVTARNLRKLRRLQWEPVPGRVSPWGNPQPLPDHEWEPVSPRTPGVPEDPDLTARRREWWIATMRAGLQRALVESKKRDARHQRLSAFL